MEAIQDADNTKSIISFINLFQNPINTIRKSMLIIKEWQKLFIN